MNSYSNKDGWPCTESVDKKPCIGIENCDNKSCPLVADYLESKEKD